MNNPLIFQHIKSSPTGTDSTTGRQMERAFNDNFDLLARIIPNITAAISIGITSKEMKQIKVDTSTNPSTVYYTLDDESVTNPTWIKLVDLNFSDIKGDPLDNITLKETLDSKAKQTDFDALENRMDTVESDIDNNTNDIQALQTLTTTHTQDIKKNTDLLNHAVINDGTGQILFKFDQTRNELSMSIDNGVHWLLINDINTGFDHVVGEVTDNRKLVDYIDNIVSDYTLLTTFNSHAGDTNNPHGVTKSQVGLGKVQNLAPSEMPISVAQKAEFDSIKKTRKENKTVTLSDYKALTPDNAILYFITSHVNDL